MTPIIPAVNGFTHVVVLIMMLGGNISSSVLIKKAIGLAKGSSTPNTNKVGKITRAQAEAIVKTKQADLTAADMDAAVRTIAGSARSMGITVEGL